MIERREQEEKLKTELLSLRSNLQNQLLLWKNQYLLIAPIDGKVEYLGFWKDYGFAQSGKEVVSIIPVQEELYGEVQVPTGGMGKVKVGQSVRVFVIGDVAKQNVQGNYDRGSGIITINVNTCLTSVNDIESVIVHELVHKELHDKSKKNNTTLTTEESEFYALLAEYNRSGFTTCDSKYQAATIEDLKKIC